MAFARSSIPARIPSFVILIAALTPLMFGSTTAEAAPAGCAFGKVSGNKLTGTRCSEVITPPAGIETIVGGPGDDTIFAIEGVKTVIAGGGDDTIYVNSDGVSVEGGDGDDEIYGWLEDQAPEKPAVLRIRQDDAVATASDSCPFGCYYGLGNDTFNGDAGNDIVFGARGNDDLSGGGGNDRLYGGLGDDEVTGDAGSDLVSGGFGADDPLDGGNDGDLVRGDGAVDVFRDTGSSGADTISFATATTPGFGDGSGYQHVFYSGFPASGGERGVYIDMPAAIVDNGGAGLGGGVDSNSSSFSGFEKVVGSPYSDFIAGTSADNVIYGGGGADVILGAGGNDLIDGGADGDHLDGGTGSNYLVGGSNDYCTNPTTSGCTRSTTGVSVRDQSKIAVGYMAAGDFGRAHEQLYLNGSTGADFVSLTYSLNTISVPTDDTVTFQVTSGSSTFDPSPGGASPCGTYTSTQVICTLPLPLETVTVSGFSGGDGLSATNMPLMTSLVVSGGDGADAISAGPSEDILVDGPDSSNDLIDGGTLDDAIANNAGADVLYGSDGNDLFLSSGLCGGDTLGGGPDVDNASWAKLQGEGVAARIAEGKAGRLGSTGPQCTSGGTLDDLLSINDLEGSAQADGLFGDGTGNGLIGRSGGDTFNARDANDLVSANSNDTDSDITCSGGSGDIARIDFYPAWNDAFNTDPYCETVNTVAGENTGG